MENRQRPKRENLCPKASTVMLNIHLISAGYIEVDGGMDKAWGSKTII